MTEDPGAKADLMSDQKWVDVVWSKHNIKAWRMPFAACKCGHWQKSAPGTMGIVRQRDWLLDEFNIHRKFMLAERRRLIEVRRAMKLAARQAREQ